MESESIWTRAFALLCLAQFLGYAQHFVLQPTFPLYVTHLGGSPFIVGLVIACFGVTNVVSRPAIGYWADRWSETGVLICGLLFQAATIPICFIPIAEATMVANGLRGIGWSGLNTGGYTLLASSAPAARRGEASGYYGGVQSGATILFPAVALWLIDAPFGGFGVVFATAIALAVIGAIVGAMIAPSAARANPRPQLDKTISWWREILNVLDREILLAAALLFASHLSLPAISSFLVLYARDIGITNFGWFYVVSGVTSLLARPLLGRVSDKIGHGYSVLSGLVMETAALCLVVMVSSLPGMTIAGMLYMLGSAIATSTTLALAVEQAKPERRGRAMASYSVAYPLSNGVGALICGSAVDWLGYVWMYLIMAGLVALGFVIILANWSRLKRA